MGGDTFENEAIETAAAAITAEQRDAVVGKRILRFRLGYDKSVRDYFARNSGQTVDNWLAEVMTHAQAHYMHSSLPNKIIFEVTSSNIILYYTTYSYRFFTAIYGVKCD